MADDLAFNDLSFRGSNEIPTPNIDALAYNGIILNRFYTPSLCTPSRTAFLSGKYPHNLGMQEAVVIADEPWGLPTDEKILPQYFKNAGYETHLIGKWHIGFFQPKYTPTRRGYDTFFGYHGPYIDYYSYTHMMFNRNYSRGYDMRRNLEVAKNLNDQYATDLFTDEAVNIIKNYNQSKPFYLQINHLSPHAGNEDFPMQAPQEDIDRFSYISDLKRRTLAAMIYRLDLSVGEVLKALKDKDLIKNSIIVFYSDNGGPTRGIHSTAASNHPLRGQKESPWEGAIRTNAIIYAPFLPKSIVKDELFYVADFLPTFRTLADAGYSIDKKIDGFDQSFILRIPLTVPQIFNPRKSVVVFDNIRGYGSLINNNLKYVNGSNSKGADDIWLGTNNNVLINSETYEENVKNSAVWQALESRLSSSIIKSIRQLATVKCFYNSNSQINSCDLLKGPCLFDIIKDPCEQNNLAQDFRYSRRFKFLADMQNNFVASALPSRRQKPDPRCDPKNFDGVWTPWIPD